MKKRCTECKKEFYTKLSHYERRKCCSLSCSSKNRIGQTPWNKRLKGSQVAWNKGKTGIYSIETRKKMGAKNKTRRSMNTEFKKGENVGPDHRLWRGNRADYTSIHSWVSRWKGRPKKCEHCGSINMKRYEWANINEEYSRNLDDYIRLCKSCHTKFDINKKINYEVERRLVKLGIKSFS